MSEATHGRKEELALKAKELGGLVIVEPLCDELLLDIDTPQDLARYYVGVASLEDNYPYRGELKTKSKGGRTHIYVSLAMGRSLQHAERSALQAALGSDARREIFNLVRIYRQDDIPICLFETPEEYARIKEWRIKFDDIPF